MDVLGEALTRPPEEREAFVRAACLPPTARDEALSLLGALERAGGFMQTPTAAPARAVLPEAPGAMIGRYKVLELIGEGGFGHVFMAEQREPVVRRVALKIIRPGMDSRAVVARFEAERQALAMMDHPGIATVFDGGATDSGRPYFAMELVKGVPITQFCDRERMPVAERLALFRDVCGAVQHAHQKGVIHRDLKPGNMLVAERDGRPHAKIIDFGIAKATFGRLTDRTLFTEFRQFVGTPEYMSPEQTLGNGADVDTRSDIYSLGVVLYELLTGTTPLDRDALRAASLADMQALIRDAPAPRPSTRLSTLNTRADIATRRRTEPARLGLLLKGDLDWIVLRALEKDRERRYESAAALAEDVRRFLASEPVSATPPSAAYRLRKFAGRNRGPVLAGLVVGAALVLGVAGTTAGLVRSIRDQHRAEETKAFIMSMLEAVTPGVARGQDTALMRRVLDEAAARLDSGEVTDPLIEAELRQTIALSYDKIGASETAEPMLHRAIELRTRAAGPADPETLTARASLGGVLLREGKLAESESILREALAAQRRVRGGRDEATFQTMNSLGVTLEKEGKFQEAEVCFREAGAGLKDALGPEAPSTIAATFNLGFVLCSQGHYTEAEPFLRRALEVRRRTAGSDDPSTLTALSALGSMMGMMGRTKECETLLLEALEGTRRVFGPDHPDTLAILNNVGGLLMQVGRPAEAEPYIRQALEGFRRRLGTDHPDTLLTLANHAVTLQGAGRLDQAEAAGREALDGMRRSPEMGAAHPRTLMAALTLATVLNDRSRFAEAAPLAREAYDGFARAFDADNGWRLSAAHTLGYALRGAQKADQAEPFLREAADGRARSLGPANPRTLTSVIALAGSITDIGRFSDAERVLLEAAGAAAPADDKSRTPPALLEALARLYEAWDRADPGAGHDAQAAACRARLPSPSPDPP